MQNIDQTEIDKFNTLAHHWWDLEGEFRPLHIINPLRLQWIDGLAQIKGKKVLDVGCGGGILSDAMAQMGANVLGIDLSKKGLRAAQLRALEVQTPNIRYQEISAEDLAAKSPAQFDVVTCMEMIEHVPNPQSLIHALTQLVKPNGWVFFATLNKNIKSYALSIVAAEHLLKLIPKGTHEYERFLTPAQLAGMARHEGLTLAAQSGLQYNPFSHTAKLISDVSVNYMQAHQA